MDKILVAKKVDKFIEDNLKGVAFDVALPTFQNYIWKLADQEGTDGPTILKTYMDWKAYK